MQTQYTNTSNNNTFPSNTMGCMDNDPQPTPIVNTMSNFNNNNMFNTNMSTHQNQLIEGSTSVSGAVQPQNNMFNKLASSHNQGFTKGANNNFSSMFSGNATSLFGQNALNSNVNNTQSSNVGVKQKSSLFEDTNSN